MKMRTKTFLPASLFFFILWAAAASAEAPVRVTAGVLQPKAMIGDDIRIVADAVPTEPGLVDLVREYNKYVLRRVAGLIGI